MDLTGKATKSRTWFPANLIFPNLVSWSTLSNIGSNKWSKSSYFWMFFVPLAATILNKVEDVSIPFLNDGESIPLSLPFSWQIFFYTSINFSLANLLFSLNCPTIVKDFKSAHEFVASGNSHFSLHRYYRELVDGSHIWISNTAKVKQLDWLISFVRRFCVAEAIHGVSAENVDERDQKVFWADPRNRQGSPEYLANLQIAFNEIRQLADYASAYARLLTFVIYLAAFSFLALLITQNILYVCYSV